MLDVKYFGENPLFLSYCWTNNHWIALVYNNIYKPYYGQV